MKNKSIIAVLYALLAAVFYAINTPFSKILLRYVPATFMAAFLYMGAFEGSGSFRFSYGSLFVILATACWGLENNCTRKISEKSTYEIVVLKGGIISLCERYMTYRGHIFHLILP